MTSVSNTTTSSNQLLITGQKCIHFFDPKHVFFNGFQKFAEMRQREEFTDFTIRAHNQRFPCHSLVLAANSRVLKKMIQSDLKEKITREFTIHNSQPEIADDELIFHENEPDMIQAILDYMYTGKFHVSRNKLVEIIRLADYLEMFHLKSMCILKLAEVMEPDIVISSYRTAELYSISSLKLRCQQVMCAKFNEVVRCADFLGFSVEEVDGYISLAADHNISSDDLVKATFTWSAHDTQERAPCIENLLRKIDLAKCSTEGLRYVMNTFPGVLQANPSFYKLFLEAFVRHNLELQKAQSIVIVTAKAHTFFKLKKDNHFEEMNKPLRRYQQPAYPSVCQNDANTIVLTGGHKSKACLKWTVTSNSWVRLQDLPVVKSRHASICVNNMMFVMGGCTRNNTWSKRVDILLLDGSTWSFGPAMPAAVKFPSAAKINTSIYVIRECQDAYDNEAALFCLDAHTMRWSSKQPLQDPGCGFSVAADDYRLFVAGGSARVCSWYNSLTDAWSAAAPPAARHIRGSLALYRGRMMLMGGETRYVEEYNEDTDSWKPGDVTLPRKLTNHTAVVLNI